MMAARREQAATLRFGVPRGGRWDEPTLAFLDSCGLRVRKSSDRQLTAGIAGMPEITVILQRQRDIMVQVADGRLDIGITAHDTIGEHGGDNDELAMLYPDLGFQASNLMVAVPAGWVDVSTLADLSDVAAAFRARGEELRVATSFPNLTKRFFYARGITHFAIVHTDGGVEAAPAAAFADVIVDVVSSGVTLRENHLKVLRNGLILRNEACLVGNRRILTASAPKRELTRRILELIDARRRGQNFYTVTANMRATAEEEVARALLASPATRGLRGPTVARVYTPDDVNRVPGTPAGEVVQKWFAATIIVEAGKLQDAVDSLRAAGGSGVSVVPLRYSFDATCRAYEAMLRELGIASSE